MTKKSEGKTKRDRAKAELHRAHTKDDGSSWTTTIGGFPIESDWYKAQKKHKKDYPKLVKNIKYGSSKIVPPYEEGPHKVKPRPQKRAEGGRIGFAHGSKRPKGGWTA